MLKTCLWAVATTCALSVWPAWATVHKCTSPDGRVSFQDAPCKSGKDVTLDIQPASGTAPPAPAPNPAAATSGGLSEAQRIEADVAKSQAERRKRELEGALLPNAKLALSQHLANCQAEQQRLQTKKSAGPGPAAPSQVFTPTHPGPRGQGLAHAQWERSVAEEMSAAARLCESRTHALTAELDALRRECAAIQCVAH